MNCADVTKSLGNHELEAEVRAAALLRGGMLQKWRKAGREKPYHRYIKLTAGRSSLSCLLYTSPSPRD